MRILILTLTLLSFIPGVYAPAPYTLPNGTATDMVGLFDWPNLVLGPSGTHYFWDMIVMAVYLVLFLATIKALEDRPKPVIRASMLASFVAFIFAVMLDVVSLVDGIAVTMPLGLTLIAIILDLFDKG